MNAMQDPAALVGRLRATVRAHATRPLAWRIEQLTRLRTLLDQNRDALAEAVYADLRRLPAETFRSEVDAGIREIDHFLEHLEQWLAPQPVTVPAEAGLPAGSTGAVRYDPLGTVLVIAPWNYPVRLLFVPVAGALAAGDTVVAKPSELAPAASALIAGLVPRYFDPDVMAVVQGAVPEATALLAERFDHVFFTGSGAVGRIVMRAAAQHLTPVTLELGGKSPVFVDAGTDLPTVARRLAAAKFANAGQTCVAPDYVLADPATAQALEPALAQAVLELYGPDPAASPAYGRIINECHFDRVVALLDSGRIVIGGLHDRAERYIAPTVLAGVDPLAPVMLEEIFGPRPAGPRGGRPRRSDRLHQPARQAPGPLRLHRQRHHPPAPGRRDHLRRPQLRPADRPPARARPSLRRRRGQRHRQLPRTTLPGNLQPPQSRARRAAGVNRMMSTQVSPTIPALPAD
jgi:aldehyde dehydrogenase (NAD+)